MSLSVTSEIGRLRSVMIHLPGLEIDRMLPSMMDELLFDDILFGERAREEHRRLRRLLGLVADEVLEFRDLLEEVFEDESARTEILDDLGEWLRLPSHAMERLRADDAPALAGHLIEGLFREDVQPYSKRVEDIFLLPPIPNIFFQRDPAVVVSDGVLISSMATSARDREALLANYIFSRHPRFQKDGGSPVTHSVFSGDPRARLHAPSLEGGDVLVPREDTLLIGVSIRTSRKAIHELAVRLREVDSPIRRIILTEIPQERSYMHLDTVFTILSEGECLLYGPAILPGGVEELDVYQIDLGSREVTYRSRSGLLSALKGAGLDLEPISCGGDDPVAAQREQWTDGANAFAVAPGVLLCYERNVHTAEELSKKGYSIIDEDDLLLGRVELDIDKAGQKVAIQTAGHELSRARGGPRCMTMPLRRDPL